MSELETIAFEADPQAYRHWQVHIDDDIAMVTMHVDATGGLRTDYDLKLNSYDLAVDIELYDVVQRLRFEHPEVRSVVLTGGFEKVFCAGANIQMLATSSHHHKVNFCKFTNETRNAIEQATDFSGQTWIAAVNGTAAGGGYELALTCDEIILVDDGSSAVSLPEIPLLAVLPGTGGLTRVVDKRHVRRDLADLFCTKSEGVRGSQALEWGLVDRVVNRTRFDEVVRETARRVAQRSDRPRAVEGATLAPLTVQRSRDRLAYAHLDVRIDRDLGAAHLTITAPAQPQPTSADGLTKAGASGWLLGLCRELDDAILHLRFNEPTVGTWVFRSEGDVGQVSETEEVLGEHSDHWFVREVRLYWTRTLKRLDVSARTILTLVEPGSCFAGTLFDLVLAADRALMIDHPDQPAVVRLTPANDGWYPMANGLSRLQSRFWGRDAPLAAARALVGKELSAREALDAELVTAIPDDLDWDEEVRLTLEERNAFSPDALTGLEANLRFVGPETLETKIFGRLSAWQNWIFQRPNAVGSEGALPRFGTGSRPTFSRERV